jgi:hypothetical protein
MAGLITRKRIVTGFLIGLGVAMVLLFGLRLLRAVRHPGGPPRPQPRGSMTDVTLIREWMTVPYIAHAYGVPERVLFRSLEVPEWENRRRSLAEINDAYFPGQAGVVAARLKQAISSFKENTQPAQSPGAPTVPAP